MKNLYLTVSFVFASGLLVAQNKDTKIADKLFDRYEYVDAANAYLKLTESGKDDNYVHLKLADSYYNIFNTKEAIKWFSKAISKKQEAEVYYKYAQMLKAEGKYEDADKQMEVFASMAPNDQRAKAFSSNPKYLPALKSQAKLFEVSKSEISSPKTDFGPVLTNDNNFYFASARNEARKNSNWNEEPYMDLYKATYNESGRISEPVAVPTINTKWHDGPATVTEDGNTIYYGSESFNDNKFTKDKEKKSKFGQIFLYKATNTDGVWSCPKPLPFNNPAYNMRNPSVSKDGKTLYFSSDMPGGLGGEDIWKVSVNGDQYGTPENLGPKINSEANESFPYISDDNVLYFSSNGKQGFGGYDVFKLDLNGTKDAINLGSPVNTEKDDFSFSYNTSKKIGFFASNRQGNDDIFIAKPICAAQPIAIVRDAKTGKPITDATVVLSDENQSTVGTQNSNANGTAMFDAACNQPYSFQASKTGYENAVGAVKKSEGGEVSVVLDLVPITPIITENEILLQAIYFEYNKSNITAEGAAELDKLVQVLNDNPSMVVFVKSHTDNRGGDKFNLDLSDRRAKATVQYVISKGVDASRISGQGFGESEPKIACTECTDDEHSKNRRSEFLIVKK